MRIPRLRDYEDDTVVNDPYPRVVTKVYDQNLRPPDRRHSIEPWPILAGFLTGAPTDEIADGISQGEAWVVGFAPMAAGRSAIWLRRHKDIAFRDQVAAWRVRGMF